MAGLIHIYCGDGKGKTTAAVGLAVRAAGAGKLVLFAQFFKNGSSSEISQLHRLENIRTLHCQTVQGLWKRMDEKQREQVCRDYAEFFGEIRTVAQAADLLVLDEILSACGHGAVPEEAVLDFLRKKPEGLEVVLTGRNPPEEFLELADYVTEMRKTKHPFDREIRARRGIEF